MQRSILSFQTIMDLRLSPQPAWSTPIGFSWTRQTGTGPSENRYEVLSESHHETG